MKINKKIIVFRDKLLLESETFIPRSYDNFKNFEVIYACSKLGWNHKILSNKKILVCKNFFFRFLFKHFGYIQNINLIKKHNPVAIHAHFGKSGALALPLAKKLEIPLIITFHGGDITKRKHFKKQITGNIFKRRLSELQNYTSLFIGVSDFISTKLVKAGFPKTRVLTHYNGIKLKYASIKTKKNKNLLFVGRLVEKKGIEVLIRAIKSLNNENFLINLDIVGSGPLEEKLRSLAKNIENIRFLGWKSESEVSDLMERCSALIVPSKTARNGDSEGLPTVILEAIKTGTIVVASDHSGIPEVIVNEKTGFIFTEGDIEQLAHQIVRVSKIDKDEKKVITDNASELLNKKFDSFVQSQRLEKLIEGIISGNLVAGEGFEPPT